jgi:hypothetical protein
MLTSIVVVLKLHCQTVESNKENRGRNIREKGKMKDKEATRRNSTHDSTRLSLTRRCGMTKITAATIHTMRC